MTKRNLFINILFLIITIIFSTISQCSSALSDKRLCYNPDCSEPVSLARTTIKYIPNEPGLLKFDISVEVKVYSKEAGNRTDLWGVEINGKHGYVPKRFLKEYKIIHKDLNYEVPINQLSNGNKVSNKKLQPKENNHKSVFDTKNVETDNLDLKSTEELPYDVTPSYEIIDGTTLHLDHEPFVQPTVATEIIQTTIVPNKQNAVDNLEINSSNDNNDNESNIFTKDAKLQQDVLDDKLKVNKQSTSNKLNIKDFVTSSEEVFDLPDKAKVLHVPSLDMNANSKTEIENAVENLENNSTFTPRNASVLESNPNTNISETHMSDTNTTIELYKTLNKTVAFNDTNIHVQDVEKIDTFDRKDVQLLKNDVTPLGIEQNESKVESKNVEHLINVSSFLLGTNITSTAEATSSLSENVEESLKNIDKLDKKDELLKNDGKSNTEQGEPKEESKNTENLSKDNSDVLVAPLFLESKAKSTAKSTLSLNINKNENNKEINLKTKSDETISFVSQDSDLNTKEGNNAIIVPNEEHDQELEKKQNILHVTHHDTKEINEITKLDDNLRDTLNASDSAEIPHFLNEVPETESNLRLPKQLLYSTDKDVLSENVMDINEFHNRNLVQSKTSRKVDIEDVITDEADNTNDKVLVEDKNDKININDILHESSNVDPLFVKESTLENLHEVEAVSTSDICITDNVECSTEDNQNNFIIKETLQNNENIIMDGVKVEPSYWLILIYLSVTAAATLIFSLGYYYIENTRRDKQLISRVNELEKDLLVATKECSVLHENLKMTKEKLTCIEDESFGSNEMVLSLKADLEVLQNVKAELEDQVAILEKDLENATEAGLELERMLREVLSSNNEVNPLAQSVEDLQTRLNAQQAANDSLTNALKLKTQENETLSTKLESLKKEYEELEVELARITDNLKLEQNSKNSLEQTLNDKVQQLEMQIKEISTEKTTLQKKLKSKEAETKDLLEVVNRLNSNNLDLDKLYDVSHIKAEATTLLEERNELKIRLVEIEGAHHLLEEHMKVVKEEIATLSEQCKVAEKEKKDAETRLEVLTKFFEEKEAQRQKEEAIWLQQQGEVVSTVERIQTMQNEIQNYKQQIEMLKREVLDQEREYKNQISVLETKAHEQWVIARQVERRLEESKVEAGQLRNRLTLIEKNINDADSEAKLHRLEANGDTTPSPALFIGAESSSSPLMFSGSASVPPPPPPSYLHSLFPPYLPPPLPNTSGVSPYEVSQRPPPLGGRLSSPPPMPLHPSVSNRYDNAGSPPPPMSPHLLPPFNHRSPPPPPFGSDIHPPPPPPPGSILPRPLGTPHSWGEESLPPPRNSGFHPSRERVRNHKGSLHSSGESLDKTRHNKL